MNTQVLRYSEITQQSFYQFLYGTFMSLETQDRKYFKIVYKNFHKCSSFSEICRIQKYNTLIDNKMASLQKALQVNNHKYPFGNNSSFSDIRVQQRHSFPSMESLLEKKSEMLRKQQMITNPAIINLLSITVEGNVLVYEWQYVPYSISSYIRSKFATGNSDIWEMTKKLMLKKVTFEITVLMSYLAKMRIQTELSMQTLGITHDQKIKLYLSPRSKMGIKTELFLISQYGQAKERILKELNAEMELIRNDPVNPKFKQTRPYFESKMLNGSLSQSITQDSFIRSEPKSCKVESRPIKKQKQEPMRRKMSIGNFDLGNLNMRRQNNKSSLRSSRTPKEHKYSFQLNSSQNLNDESFNASYFENQRENIINHSKSIKIELQQNEETSPQRKRKDSIKVKITTCRQYEVQDPQLFSQSGDIFEYFAAKARQEEQTEARQARQSEKTQQKQRQNLNTTATLTPPPSPLPHPRGTSQNLQERLLQVRQRSQKVLLKLKSVKR